MLSRRVLSPAGALMPLSVARMSWSRNHSHEMLARRIRVVRQSQVVQDADAAIGIHRDVAVAPFPLTPTLPWTAITPLNAGLYVWSIGKRYRQSG